MKLKIKIFGWSEGSRRSITRTIDIPDFEDRVVGFDESILLPETGRATGRGVTWRETIEDQQEEWIDDNYESVVIPLAEEAFLYPIFDCKIVRPKVSTKKEDIIEILTIHLAKSDIQTKAIVIGTLHELWPSVKNLSSERIVSILYDSVSATDKITVGVLKQINENIDAHWKSRTIKKLAEQ